MELLASLLTREAPVDLYSITVDLAIPGCGFILEKIKGRNPAVTEALPGQQADFDLRLIQPASVLWGVVNLESAPQVAATSLAEVIGERFLAVDVEVVHHQVDLASKWTIQQFRETLAFDHHYRFLIHDRDCIFVPAVDAALKGFGVRPLKTPVRTLTAFIERLGGTFRRECLDYLIPFGERHLRSIVKEYSIHYNRGRPHTALGPGARPAFRSRIRSRFQPAFIDTSSPPVTVLHRSRFSVGSIMITS